MGIWVHQTGDLHLLVGGVAAEGVGAQSLHRVNGGGDLLLGETHHVQHGPADDVVQCHQDGQGQEGPEAAAHGVDALPLVQLLDLLVVLRLVVAVLLLEPRHLSLHGVHLHHALFALVGQGEEDHLGQQGEHDQGQGVVAAELVQPQQERAEYL